MRLKSAAEYSFSRAPRAKKNKTHCQPLSLFLSLSVSLSLLNDIKYVNKLNVLDIGRKKDVGVHQY